MLQDVVRTMFNAKFIEELMKPQELYSMSSLRGIFDRLAHSSIMRLSESSMDKVLEKIIFLFFFIFLKHMCSCSI